MMKKDTIYVTVRQEGKLPTKQQKWSLVSQFTKSPI